MTEKAMKKGVFASIPEALEALRQGRMIVVVDDERRENEGDLVIAAQFVTPEAVNFLLHHGRGILCLALSGEWTERLGLSPLSPTSRDSFRTAWHTPVDVKRGITTGTSAKDRAATIRAASEPEAAPEDFVCGHVSTLRAEAGGVLVRAGHTEASVDLMRMAGCRPVAAICEVMKENGEMARLPELMKFAEKYRLPMLSVASIIDHRRKKEKLITYCASSKAPTIFGDFVQHVYQAKYDPAPHIAVVKGEFKPEALRGKGGAKKEPVLVRVHSECFTGDTLGSVRCDCREQLHSALSTIEREGEGIVLYMRQEGRGIGLINKVKAYALQDRGQDTVEANHSLGFAADLRHYGVGAQILYDLGVRKIRILTNNPKKISGLEGYGLEVAEQIPLKIPPRPENAGYLDTKRTRLGHNL